MPRDYRFWTTGETHRLFTLFYQNYSYEEIASIMGRSVESVRRQRQRIDKKKRTVRARRLLSRKDLQFVELFSQVHTHAEVAQKMGVTRNSSMCKKRRLIAKGFEFPKAKGRSLEGNILKKQRCRYDSTSEKAEGWKEESNISRIRTDPKGFNYCHFEDDQEHFILKMGELKKRLRRMPTDAEVFAESLRIGYRKVS